MNDDNLAEVVNVDSGGGLLSEVYSISESEFRKNDFKKNELKKRRTSVQSDDYVASSRSCESSESDSGSDSDYSCTKKKGKKKKVKKVYRCHLCKYNSVLKHVVDKHIKTHDTGKLFSCKLCQLIFTNAESAEVHQRLHEMKNNNAENSDESCEIVGVDKNVDPFSSVKYKCHRCSFTSINITAVKIHKRSHAKDRPYRCPKCPYATCDSLILTKHAKSHNSEPKPYKCDICDKLFSEMYDLTKHKVEHFAGQHYFKCGICPYKCVALI